MSARSNSPRTRADLCRDIAREPVAAEVAAALTARCRLRTTDRCVVVGASGGPDSTALAAVLAALAARRPREFPQVVLVSVHHGLRAEADDECALVARLGRRLGVPTERVDVRPGERQGNISANARVDRYAALTEAATRFGASLVATAHHADDRLETMLLALARGRGLRGLANPRWSRRLGDHVRLIRPLLATRRAALADLCQRFDLEIAVDPTNADPARGRGHLRRAVLPLLVARSPAIALHASRLADEAALAVAALEDLVVREFGDRTLWPRELFIGRDPALAAWVLRRAARSLDSLASERVPRRAWEQAARAAVRSVTDRDAHPRDFRFSGGISCRVGRSAVRLDLTTTPSRHTTDPHTMTKSKEPSPDSDHRPLVVLVGHCTPDSGMLTTLVSRHTPSARIERVNDHSALAAHRRPGVIWLVNRVPDGDFPHDGLGIIEESAKGDDGPTLILISNYGDAQAEAADLGALAGFGKASLYSKETASALTAAFAHAAARAVKSSAKK